MNMLNPDSDREHMEHVRNKIIDQTAEEIESLKSENKRLKDELEQRSETGQVDAVIMLPKHVIEEIQILCNMTINSNCNIVQKRSAEAILKNLKEAI